MATLPRVAGVTRQCDFSASAPTSATAGAVPTGVAAMMRAGIHRAHRANRRRHRLAGAHTVVDQKNRAVRDVRRRSRAPAYHLACSQPAQRVVEEGAFRRANRRRGATLVEHERPRDADGAEQVTRTIHDQWAAQDEVEREIERPGNLESRMHATADDTEDQCVAVRPASGQHVGQCSPACLEVIEFREAHGRAGEFPTGMFRRPESPGSSTSPYPLAPVGRPARPFLLQFLPSTLRPPPDLFGRQPPAKSFNGRARRSGGPAALNDGERDPAGGPLSARASPPTAASAQPQEFRCGLTPNGCLIPLLAVPAPMAPTACRTDHLGGL